MTRARCKKNPPRRPGGKKTLCLFSYGLHPDQVTLETLAAMRGCGAVYTNCLDAGTVHLFPHLGPRLKLMTSLDRAETARIVASGFREHDTVGFLTYGNPLFLNQAAAGVIKAAAGSKPRVRVFPAVSSFDSLVNLFNLNKYSPAGLRLVDAASALSRPAFTPEMDTLIFVPDVLNLPANAGYRKKFLAAARKAYPSSAPAYLADCASLACNSEKVEKGSVGGLEKLLSLVNGRHTIFIPAVK